MVIQDTLFVFPINDKFLLNGLWKTRELLFETTPVQQSRAMDSNYINKLKWGFSNLKRNYTQVLFYTKCINIGGPVEYHTYKTFITIHPYGPALHKPVYCAYRSHDFNTHNSWAGQPHKHCTTSPLPINRWLSCCETVFTCWVTILWLFCKLFQQAGLRLQEKIHSIGCLCIDVHYWPLDTW